MGIDERTGYFICEISTGVVYTNGCVRDTMTADLPGGKRFYRAELTNGQDIILISHPAVKVGPNLYSQSFSVFDELFTHTYHEHMEVRFYINDSAVNYSHIGIRLLDRVSDTELGDLIHSEDVIAFEQEIIEDKESRRTYLKVAMLKR